MTKHGRRTFQVPYRLKRRSRWGIVRHRFRALFIWKDNLFDIIGGVIRDYLRRKRIEAQPNVEAQVLGSVAGEDVATPRRWCLFAAYSPAAVVTEMIFSQLGAYAEAGFSVVYITMSETLEAADRQRLKEVCTHVVHRESFGRDFGAWAHAARLLRHELEPADAILLTNDSNLGPFVPLQPWIDGCLEREGIFGLTESLGGGSHIQSYFVLANGKDEVSAILNFLGTLRLSHSKWLMVQRGEIGLSTFMRKKGHYVGAVVDYSSIEEAFLGDVNFWPEMEVVVPPLFRGMKEWSRVGGVQEDSYELVYNRSLLRSRLFLFPLNPSHHFNQVLMRHFQFPFVKVELVVKNPAGIPSAPGWRSFIDDQSPVTEAMIEDHLDTLIGK